MALTFQHLAACSPSPRRIDLFAAAEGGGIRHRVFDGGWQPWDWSSERLTLPAAVSPQPGRIELFAISPGRDLMRRRFDGAWSQWESLGPVPALHERTPQLAVAARSPEQLDIFLIGYQEHFAGPLWHRRVGADPSEWESFAPPHALHAGVAATSPSPGRVDVVVMRESILGTPSLWHRRFEGAWTEWASLPPVPRFDRPLACAPRAGVDVFTARSSRLTHSRLEGPQPPLTSLGGDITSGLAAVSPAPGQVDVIAAWRGTALLHRSFRGSWSEWTLVALQPEPATQYRVLRPRDLVQLEVSGFRLQARVRHDGLTELTAAGRDARLVVGFPPQHVGEQAQVAADVEPLAARAGPSRLTFAVGLREVVVLTVHGLLDAMSRLPLVTAAPGTVPGPFETAIEMPWRLVLSPQADLRCDHIDLPRTVSFGATELWHSRLTQRDGSARVAVTPVAALPPAPSDNRALDSALTADNRNAIVQAASQAGPASADRLILSAYGGWLSLDTGWHPGAAVQWNHRAATGRDYHVRVLTRGALFPFGHRAVYAEVTERRFRPHDRAARLERRTLLMVTEPVREYGHGAGGAHERGFPFQRVTIDPEVVEPLDPWPPWIPHIRAFWPFRNGSPVDFALRADAGGEPVELRLPLLFVADSALTPGSARTLDNLYEAGPPRPGGGTFGAARASVGRRIPLAMKSATEPMAGAVQEVHSMRIGADAMQGSAVGFHPRVRDLQVALPAARQLLGLTQPVPVRLSRELVEAGPGEEPDVLLDLDVPLNIGFSGHAARAGGLAAPDFTATRISRTRGPLAQLPSDPRTLFDANAKLLGVVALREVIKQIGTPPRLVWSEPAPGEPPTATFNWQAPLKTFGPFTARPGALVELQVESRLEPQAPPNPPKVVTVTSGRVTNFTLHFLPDEELVALDFDALRFVARAGERPQVTFDLHDTRLLGKLKLVRDLQELIPQAGAGGAQIDVTPAQIRVTYRTSLPQLAFGVFTLQNLVLDTWLALSLKDEPLTVGFSFGSRERPFLVTVSMFGGGGYLEIGIDPAGLKTFVGGLEFGASVAMDFVVASGEVHVFGGVVFARSGNQVELTGYLRIGGSVELLGLISVSVELTLSLRYLERGGKSLLVGEARIVVKVDLTFWSTSVELSCHKEFAGSSLDAGDAPFARLDAGPRTTVAAALGPVGDSRPMEDYCRAFAVEVGHDGPA